MASNKHYEIELLSVVAQEMEAPSLEQLLQIADLPNMLNPFGNRLKHGKFVIDGGKKWLLDDRIADFNYQRSGYSSEVSQFRFSLSFDTALVLNELDADRFLYSIARHISQSRWRKRRQGVGAFFQLGQVEEGSIRAEIFAGILAVGAFVSNYPALKQGFYEILTDGQFLSEQISTAIRAAKIPEPTNDDEQEDARYVLGQEPRRRARDPNREHLFSDD